MSINLSPEKENFANAVWGREVRSSMVSMANKLETACNDAIDNQLIQLDNALKLNGYGADAEATGFALDMANLKTKALYSDGVNIARAPEDYPFKGSINPKTGVIGDIGENDDWFHGFWEAKAGTYYLSSITTKFGTNAPYLPLFDGAGNYVRSVSGTVANYILTVSLTSEDLDGVRYFGHSTQYDGTYHGSLNYSPLIAKESVDTWKTPNERLIKEKFIPRYKHESEVLYSRSALDNVILNKNANLVSISDLRLNGFFAYNNSTHQIEFLSSNNYRAGYVQVEKLGYYYLYYPRSSFGTSATNIPLFTYNKNPVESKLKRGTLDDDGIILEVELDDPNYMTIGYSYKNNSAYPPFIIYSATQQNISASDIVAAERELSEAIILPQLAAVDVLMNKTLVFDGDSICAGAKDSESTLKGWAGRIINNNSANGHNYAVGGGTITAGTTYSSTGNNRYWISRNIDTIHNAYPDLDYLILEGGTNDADVIGRFSGETPPDDFGSWTDGDYSGEYNDETFCGAVETLFYKAVTLFKNAKIGFVIAMEMGANNSTGTVANRRRYFDEIIKIAEKWHIPILDLWKLSHMDARIPAHYDGTMTEEENVEAGALYADGQHPTTAGYEVLTPIVEAWMKTL